MKERIDQKDHLLSELRDPFRKKISAKQNACERQGYKMNKFYLKHLWICQEIIFDQINANLEYAPGQAFSSLRDNLGNHDQGKNFPDCSTIVHPESPETV